MSELLACPFCGGGGLDWADGSTFRWLVASCSSCGATAGETRIQTVGEGDRQKWWEQAKIDAVKQWNTRTPLPEPSRKALLQLALDAIESGNVLQQTRAVVELQKELGVEVKTGWPPGMLQDDDKKLSKWLANTPNARQDARDAAHGIGEVKS